MQAQKSTFEVIVQLIPEVGHLPAASAAEDFCYLGIFIDRAIVRYYLEAAECSHRHARAAA